MPRSTSNRHIALINPSSPNYESYRTLRTNIQFSSVNIPTKVIMVTSSQKGEGKTMTASNLAVAYAQDGKRVLLVDTDLRNPSLHHVFSLTNRAGLSSVLANQAGWQEVIRDTGVENLSILTSGPIPPNPSELLGSSRMQGLMDDLKDRYDIIIADTTSVLAVTDSLVLSPLCDGVVLVVAAGKVEKDFVKKAKANLEHVNARILGLVLIKSSRKDSGMTKQAK
ncbi:CpsD/CapB family tyrosine-protein kinase [Paenibacillus xanthanilyticus]|uniref:non-specific protein-tyrosine kinase n=1 Tax=Paenibacillus xanthanilyticus TaxID=1783531 RepID=A0ABV8KAV2_9BACL